MRHDRLSWIDLEPGAPVFGSDGAVVGEVTHVSPDLVLLDMGYARPTVLKGPCIKSNVVRLGQRLFFTAPR